MPGGKSQEEASLKEAAVSSLDKQRRERLLRALLSRARNMPSLLQPVHAAALPSATQPLSAAGLSDPELLQLKQEVMQLCSIQRPGAHWLCSSVSGF